MLDSHAKGVIRENLGNVLREIKIALTPVPKPQGWLFLVGCYNSGTTLLAELLGAHPQISALPTEGHFITDQFVKDYDVGLPRMWAGREELFRLTETSTGPDPIRVKKEWGMRLDRSKPWLLEKSPPNTARTRWLQHHFAPAYFVCIVRNGYAVSEGITRKADPRHLRDSWPVEQSALQWRRSNEVMEEDASHLSHLLWMKYEDLVTNPTEELNRVASFIGIDAFPRYDKSAPLAIHERKDPLKNMNAQSIDRLSSEQIARINAVAGDMLGRYGYEVLGADGA